MRHPLVELAREALRRVATAPPAAGLATAALAELEARADRPLAVALRGEPTARTRIVEAVLGASPVALGGRGAVVALCRGDVAGARVVHEDGRVEELAGPRDRRAEREAEKASAVAARDMLGAQERALVRIDRAVPAIARARPAWWMLWLWPVCWLARWLARGPIAEQRAAEQQITAARSTLATSERALAALEAEEAQARARYHEQLAAARTQPGVEKIELVAATGPLPAGIAVIVDGEAAVDALVDGAGLDLAALPALATQARAVAIARRAGEALLAARGTIGAALEEVEATCRTRRMKLDEQRIADPDAFADLQLARIDGEIVTSVSAVLEHASVHLGSELAQLQAAWIGAIAGATSGDELKAAVTSIAEGWDASAQRVAEEVRVLVAGGLGGSARDLYPSLVAPLAPRGLPAAHAGPLRAAPVLPAFTVVPSLATAKSKLDAPSWLAGLVRTFESRRTSVREKVHERIEHLGQVAAAELRDAEPRLRAVIAEALRVPLGHALQQQHLAYEAAVAADRITAARAREAVAPLAQIAHTAGEDLERLSAELART